MRTGMNSVRVSEFSLQRLLQILAGVLLAIVATAPAIAAEAALLEHLEVSHSTDDLPAMRKRQQICWQTPTTVPHWQRLQIK